ncbi:MAG TPA: PspC domain-containing protein [Pseudonocardiaceae bacterium]|nr:PspC domain-containing protein [Pseudonocardiaceae bacterium]
MSATQRDSANNVEDMMKDFVATRPRRPKSGRVIAGVAAGIGRRYAIDPVIVRVALVCSAIYGGAGLLAYLLGWLFLTAEEDEVSPFEALLGRGHSSTSKGLTVVLCIALIPAGDFVFGGHYSTLAGVIVLLAALFLLHRYRGHLGQVHTGPAPTGGDQEARPMTGTVPTDGTTGPQDAVPADARVEDAVPTTNTEPPAWDPLGAAPFAWDLPEPTPAEPEQPRPAPRRHKSRVGLATVGLLFVTAAAFAVFGTDNGWATPPHVIGVLTAVAGIGLVTSAFLHGGRGLIWLAALLCAGAFAATATGINGWHGAGDNTFRPTSVQHVRPVYQQSVGNLRVDLSDLPPAGNVHTSVRLGAGNLTVVVPKDARVTAVCQTKVGDVDCLGVHTSGAGNPSVTANQQPASGDRLTIQLGVRDGAGQVRVTTNG